MAAPWNYSDAQSMLLKLDPDIILRNDQRELNHFIGYIREMFTGTSIQSIKIKVEPLQVHRESGADSETTPYSCIGIEDYEDWMPTLSLDLSQCSRELQLKLLISDGLRSLCSSHGDLYSVLHHETIHVVCYIGEITKVTSRAAVGTKVLHVNAPVMDENVLGDQRMPFLGCTLAHVACLAGDAEWVRSLIKSKTHVDTKDDGGRTLLVYAVNDQDILRILISAGANVNASDSEGKTPLFYAIASDNLHNARLLLEAGANPNAADLWGDKPLFYAVSRDNADFVSLLLDFSADVNTKDRGGNNALYHAISTNNVIISRLLVERGVSVNATDSMGKTPLRLAMEREHVDLTRLLVDASADINATDNEGKTSLFYSLGHKEITRILIEAKADLDARDLEGQTPLFHALTTPPQANTMSLLVEAGSNINLRDQEGNVVLFKWLDDEHVVKYLVENGADVNARDRQGKTSLFLTKNQAVIRILIEKGANVNARDYQGRTALYHAFLTSYDSVCILLENGARLNVSDQCFLSVLSFAINDMIDNWPSEKRHSNRRECADKFLKLIFEENDKLGIESKELVQVVLDVVLCFFLKIQARPSSHRNHLLYATREILKRSISHVEHDDKAKIKRQKVNLVVDLMGDKFPAHFPQMCDLLLDLGAHPDSPDGKGNTALSYAVLLPFRCPAIRKGGMNICRLLVSYGSAIWMKNYKGETPLFYFLRKKHELHKTFHPIADMVEFMLNSGSQTSDTTKTGEGIYHLLITLYQSGFIEGKHISEIVDDNTKVMELMSCHPLGLEASVNVTDRHLDTPLHLWAALSWNKQVNVDELSKFLEVFFGHFLSKDAKLDLVNARKETPLHLCRTWSAMKLLLEAGANPNPNLNYEGDTPLISQLKRVLAERITQNDNSGHLTYIYPDAMELGLEREKFWEEAVSYNIDLTVTGCESLLSLLLLEESFELADCLLKTLSSSPRYCSSDASTSALLDICKDPRNDIYWKVNLVDVLLKAGAKVNVKTQDGQTPLHLSCKNAVNSGSVGNAHFSIVQRLLLYDADCNIADDNGKTCCQIASSLPGLKELLETPVNIDDIPFLIPWNNKTKSPSYVPLLAEVARRHKSEQIEAFHFHTNPIGSGAFGFVHAGINSKDGREVAVKRIVKQRLIRPQDRREVKNLTRLEDCSQVLGYLYYTEDHHFVYIILELMDGNLDEYLDNSPDPKNHIKLCQDVCLGVEFLHRKDILHRDLKPANILYKRNPLCLKIADFGLSSSSDYFSSMTNTVMHTNAGTRCWMAPELMKAIKNVNHTTSSDMFACGLVLHFILSGRKHPFAPVDCVDKSPMEVQTETERNIMHFDPLIVEILSPEASHAVTRMIDEDKTRRMTATETLAHPFFWSNNKKMQFLQAVGNQPEIMATSVSVVAADLERSFLAYHPAGTWVTPIIHIYNEMTSSRRSRRYTTTLCVELVRFIRNAYQHVSEVTRSSGFKTQLLEDFVFLHHFPWLVIEVFNAVMKAGWHQAREEVKGALGS